MNTQCPSAHNARSTSGQHRCTCLQLQIAVSVGHCRNRTRLCATTSDHSVERQCATRSVSVSVQQVAAADGSFAHLMLQARQHYLLELWTIVLLSSGCAAESEGVGHSTGNTCNGTRARTIQRNWWGICGPDSTESKPHMVPGAR